MHVAVVGGSGLVGAALVQRLLLLRHDVLVVDRFRPKSAVAWQRCDLMTARPRFDGIDVVVHLAARVDPPKDQAERSAMRRLHEQGTDAVVAAAQAAGVKRFVLVSSAVVYGAWPHNPVPLTEDRPLCPSPMPYAIDKAMQEVRVSRSWGEQNLAIVRPAIVYARQARSYLTEILRHAPFLPALDGCRPPLQFVHVDDVAAVIAAAAEGEADGAFHACSCDWLGYGEVARLAGLRVVDVPARLVGPLLDRALPFLPPHLRAPSSLFPYLMHPFVLSADKTRRVLGVETSSSTKALQSILM